MSSLIGKTIIGFKFLTGYYKNLTFSPSMEYYIGKVGIVCSYNSGFDCYNVQFSGGQKWSYPACLIEDYLVAEPILHENTTNFSSKEQEILETKTMNYFKTKEILNREITVVVSVSEEGCTQVYSGYSVRNPDDKPNKELAKKIALGRAFKKTLTPDLAITKSMKHKYILAAIAEKLLSDIERGNIEIKGIKKEKKDEAGTDGAGQ